MCCWTAVNMLPYFSYLEGSFHRHCADGARPVAGILDSARGSPGDGGFALGVGNVPTSLSR